jgi:hypothetical protein
MEHLARSPVDEMSHQVMVHHHDVESELVIDLPHEGHSSPQKILGGFSHEPPRDSKNKKWPARARASFYRPETTSSLEDDAEIDKGTPCLECMYASCYGDTVPLQPSDTIIRYWELFMMFLLLYVTFVTTYEIAFVKREKIVFDGLFVVNRLVDLGFIFDLWFNFNVGYADEEGLMVLSKSKVRRRYLKGWFPLDFLALLPFGMIGYIMNNDDVKDMAFMRLIRLLRLMKLARLMKASRIITKVMISSDLLMRQWAFIKTFLMLALFFHWSVCGLMILTDVEGADPNWQTMVRLQQAGDGDGRFLKSGGSGGDDGGEIIPETNWYLEGSKYSLAVFGVWAFEPPAMVSGLLIDSIDSLGYGEWAITSAVIDLDLYYILTCLFHSLHLFTYTTLVSSRSLHLFNHR